MRKYIILVALTILSHGLTADTWTDPSTGYMWSYTVTDGTVTIGLGGSVRAVSPIPVGDFVIPERINGILVTRIEGHAFYYCPDMTSVRIPSTVVAIGRYSFCDCRSLRMLDLSNVKSIDASAFGGCENVSTVILSDGIEYLHCDAFAGTGKITKVSIPPRFKMSDWFSASCENITEVEIVAGSDEVCDFAFAYCSRLTSIQIPATVSKIGKSAFQDCSMLRSVEMPNGVTKIGDNAFKGCGALESMAIPETVETIGSSAFANCQKLTSIVIPESVTTIGNSAFAGCEQLTSVEIPETVVSIGSKAFAGTGVCLVEFNANGGSGKMARQVIQGSESCALTSNSFERVGYTFAGWGLSYYSSAVAYEDGASVDPKDATSTGTLVLYAIWTANTYRIKFDVNGGDGSVNDLICTYGKTVYSPSYYGKKKGYQFVGWAKEPDGEPLQSFSNLTAENNGVVTLYAIWRGKEYYVYFSASTSSAEGSMPSVRYEYGTKFKFPPNTFTCAGKRFVGWAASSYPYDEVLFVDGQEVDNLDVLIKDDWSWSLQVYAVWESVVPKPVISSLYGLNYDSASNVVMITCATNDVTIYYSTGAYSTRNGKPVSGFKVYKGPFVIYDNVGVAALAMTKEEYVSEMTYGYVTKNNGLSAAINMYDYLPDNDADAPWTVDTEVSHDGVKSVRSGAIGENGVTTMKVTVRGAGRLSFWWKSECEAWDEDYYDYGAFCVGSEAEPRLRIAGMTDWKREEVVFDGTGKHVCKWEYHKDDAETIPRDCIWVDQVQWLPYGESEHGHTLTTEVPVPYLWLDSYGLGRETDFETAAKMKLGKVDGAGRAMSVEDDYVAGTDPTNLASKLTATIKMGVDGKPILSWKPPLNGETAEGAGIREGVRSYSVYGKQALDDAAEKWTPVAEGDEGKYRFFKVGVGMPE